jgi:hypothetical protein
MNAEANEDISDCLNFQVIGQIANFYGGSHQTFTDASVIGMYRCFGDKKVRHRLAYRHASP